MRANKKTVDYQKREVMLDIFGLIVGFVLVILGTATKNYWFSILIGFVIVLFYPDVSTVLWMTGAIVLGVAWQFVAKKLSKNQYFLTVALFSGAILSVTLGQTLLGIFFFLVMIALFVLGLLSRSTKKIVGKAKENWEDVKKDSAAAKGQFPAGAKEIESALSTTGGKIGEALRVDPKQRLASPKTGQRIAEGAKNFMEGVFRLFK